jgi:hypothetical protein
MRYLSKPGALLAGAFLVLALLFILSEGLFTSAAVLLMGAPWIFLFGSAGFFSPQSVTALGSLILFALLINLALVYGLGILGEIAWKKYVR